MGNLKSYTRLPASGTQDFGLGYIRLRPLCPADIVNLRVPYMQHYMQPWQHLATSCLLRLPLHLRLDLYSYVLRATLGDLTLLYEHRLPCCHHVPKSLTCFRQLMLEMSLSSRARCALRMATLLAHLIPFQLMVDVLLSLPPNMLMRVHRVQ